MNEKILSIFHTLIGLIAFLLIAWGFYELSKYFLDIFSQLSKDVAASIIAAASTVLISVGSIIVSKLYERRKEIRKEHREKKVPVYEELISFLLKVFLAEKAGRKKLSEKEITIFLMDFTEKIIVWGSDEVIKSFQKFREETMRIPINKDEVPHIKSMFYLEDLMLEIRKDLGHKNKDFKKGDVLSLFINDIEKYI